jgi:hypothetical protein
MTLGIAHAIALVSAGLFAGGAMMQSVVDHPSRLAAESAVGLDQMQRSLRAADPYMPLLASAGAMSSFWSFRIGAEPAELLAAILLLTVIPFTLIFIMPVNKSIHRLSPSNAAEFSRLMHRWGRLHAIRSLCGLVALMALAMWNVLRP